MKTRIDSVLVLASAALLVGVLAIGCTAMMGLWVDRAYGPATWSGHNPAYARPPVELLPITDSDVECGP